MNVLTIPCIQMDALQVIALLLLTIGLSGILFMYLERLISKNGNEPMRTLWFPNWQAGIIMMCVYILIILFAGIPGMREAGWAVTTIVFEQCGG